MAVQSHTYLLSDGAVLDPIPVKKHDTIMVSFRDADNLKGRFVLTIVKSCRGNATGRVVYVTILHAEDNKAMEDLLEREGVTNEPWPLHLCKAPTTCTTNVTPHVDSFDRIAGDWKQLDWIPTVVHDDAFDTADSSVDGAPLGPSDSEGARKVVAKPAAPAAAASVPEASKLAIALGGEQGIGDKLKLISDLRTSLAKGDSVESLIAGGASQPQRSSAAPSALAIVDRTEPSKKHRPRRRKRSSSSSGSSSSSSKDRKSRKRRKKRSKKVCKSLGRFLSKNVEEADDESSESDFRSPPTQQYVAKTHARSPGRLAAQAFAQMESLLRGASAECGVGAQSPGALVMAYQTQFLAHKLKDNKRSLREARTLAVALDYMMRGDTPRALDTLVQRLKSLEVAADDSHWENAKFLEVIQGDTAGLMSVQERVGPTKCRSKELAILKGNQQSSNRSPFRGRQKSQVRDNNRRDTSQGRDNDRDRKKPWDNNRNDRKKPWEDRKKENGKGAGRR